MNVFSVGPDDLDDYELKAVREDGRFEWFIYWYESGSWEGSGYALAYNKEDGLLHHKSLSHCSCYGPMEDWASCGEVTVDEFLNGTESVFDYDCRDEIKIKAIELLKG